ncbi:MAG TPA: RuBisCO large subunit C-terminal-like domain-containing protein [Opitutaceae bacterium]|nr:RuBisCO large subunit C-terminal-like domain-containing protein [Opitutaceae bacterium]
MNEDDIEVIYRVRTASSGLDARIEALLLEQTVELKRAALRTAYVREHFVGRVIAAEPLGTDEFRVRLAQPADAVAGNPAQLLNVLFGNCSLQPEVELEDVRVPPAMVRTLGGPRFGIEGLRRLTGVRGRAITASVLKPIGLSVGETAALCRTLALSGLDVIKDDHGLPDHPYCPFSDRVRVCLGATAEAAQTTGRRTIYVPNLIGSPATVLRQARQANELGVEAVLVSPMILGLAFFNELVQDLGRPVLAHPAFGGAQRIAPAALLGKLFPLFGADAVIYPNAGGRFSYSSDVCSGIARALRTPDAGIAPAMPAPAGGIKIENVAAVLRVYGADTMLLVGGSLLEAPDPDTLLRRSRQFVGAVHAFPYPP